MPQSLGPHIDQYRIKMYSLGYMVLKGTGDMIS